MDGKVNWLCLYLLSAVVLSDVESICGQSANPFTQLVEASRTEMVKKEGRLYVSLY